jgi:hypothetical protein
MDSVAVALSGFILAWSACMAVTMSGFVLALMTILLTLTTIVIALAAIVFANPTLILAHPAFILACQAVVLASILALMTVLLAETTLARCFLRLGFRPAPAKRLRVALAGFRVALTCHSVTLTCFIVAYARRRVELMLFRVAADAIMASGTARLKRIMIGALRHAYAA